MLLNIPYTTKQKALQVQVQYISIYKNSKVALWAVFESQSALNGQSGFVGGTK